MRKKNLNPLTIYNEIKERKKQRVKKKSFEEDQRSNLKSSLHLFEI